MLVCECGSSAISITTATEQTDDNGYVVRYTEHYRCECGRRGTLEHKHGRDYLSGCLTRSGGW